MCGISCILNIYKHNLSNNKLKSTSNLYKFLKFRGPNAESNCNYKNYLEFYSFVLWQQGSNPTIQPLISDKFILIFNGDLFNIQNNIESDTKWLLNQLDICESENDIRKLFKNLNGPFSVIFFNKTTDELYFGRDSLGRNSLLIESNNDGCLRISSNSYMDESLNFQCNELDSIGIFKINLNNLNYIKLFPWLNSNVNDECKKNLQNLFHIPILIGESIDCIWLEKNILAKKSYDFYSIVESNLQNSTENTTSIFSYFLNYPEILNCVEKLLELLTNSIENRIRTTPKFCINCINENKIDICNHSKIGILFSGGLDCTILASLANQVCNKNDSIDLINVAFEKNLNKDFDKTIYDVPDRISGRKSFNELKLLYPKRKWNFIEINVTRNELKYELENNIKHVIYPLENILDESIGSAFWFAAKGSGLCNNSNYVSPSRVILLGSGADELFGGYTRHRNAFNRTNGTLNDKLNSVLIELDLDWKRISKRNLGRDDRVIGYHGRTARSPYIEENLINYIINLLPEEKCCFKLDQGIGDKLLLRLCAFKLNLNFSATLQKRAIQFGSKIANRKQNAKDISEYLKKL